MDHSEAVRIQAPSLAPNADRRRDDRADERGIALVMAILFTIVVVGIAVAGAMTLRAHQAKTRVSFITHGQMTTYGRGPDFAEIEAPAAASACCAPKDETAPAPRAAACCG